MKANKIPKNEAIAMVEKARKDQPVYIRPSTLKEIRYILRDICDSLCKKDHACSGCRATAVLKMVEKDLRELNKGG